MVRASTSAAGLAAVSWEYDEQFNPNVADEFPIVLTPLSGQATPAPIDVAHVAPRRSYSEEVGPLAEGAWRVQVFARKSGNSHAVVPGFDFEVDSTEAASGLPALAAA